MRLNNLSETIEYNINNIPNDNIFKYLFYNQ